MVASRENSIHYTAPRLWNSLPRYLRDDVTANPKEWKTKLDELLSIVPDNPKTIESTPGVCNPVTVDPSNSLVHWLPHLGLNNRRKTRPVV